MLFLTLAAGCATRAPTKIMALPEPEQTQPSTPTEDTRAQEGAQDEAPAEVAKGPTVADLCEPLDKRRPYPTDEQRRATKKLIRATCKALGVDRNTCQYFVMVALRESSYRPWVRHKLSGDVAEAVRAWIAASDLYGWDVHWPYAAHKREDLAAIVMAPCNGNGHSNGANPYYPDVERWMTGGLGLGGLNVSYHLAKFDHTAPPEILCDPVINVMVQVDLARAAVDRYGARNFYEVQAVYGGRTYRDRNGRARALSCVTGCPGPVRSDAPKNVRLRAAARRGDAQMHKRCRQFGIDCLAKPGLGRVLRGRDVTTRARYELADSIRGAPLPPFDPPPDPGSVAPQVVSELHVGQHD
jgi:hypothetical protein